MKLNKRQHVQSVSMGDMRDKDVYILHVTEHDMRSGFFVVVVVVYNDQFWTRLIFQAIRRVYVRLYALLYAVRRFIVARRLLLSTHTHATLIGF